MGWVNRPKRPATNVVATLSGRTKHNNVRVLTIAYVRLNRFVRAVRVPYQYAQMTLNNLVYPVVYVSIQTRDSP
jgi:hypothetical protein